MRRRKLILVAILIPIFVEAEGPTKIGIKIATRIGQVSAQLPDRRFRIGHVNNQAGVEFVV